MKIRCSVYRFYFQTGLAGCVCLLFYNQIRTESKILFMFKLKQNNRIRYSCISVKARLQAAGLYNFYLTHSFRLHICLLWTVWMIFVFHFLSLFLVLTCSAGQNCEQFNWCAIALVLLMVLLLLLRSRISQNTLQKTTQTNQKERKKKKIN